MNEMVFLLIMVIIGLFTLFSIILFLNLLHKISSLFNKSEINRSHLIQYISFQNQIIQRNFIQKENDLVKKLDFF